MLKLLKLFKTVMYINFVLLYIFEDNFIIIIIILLW